MLPIVSIIRYTFEGSVPVNLGCLHASVSHFNSNDFIVQVSCCFNAHDIADKVMKIIEHRGVANHEVRLHGYLMTDFVLLLLALILDTNEWDS